jgi:thioredoxin reductase (NADPH)
VKSNHELIVIGGGPAGLTAGLYASRAGLDTLLIEKGIVGGQIVNAERVENYPGFPDGIGGFELAQLIYRQATKYGLKTLNAEVSGIDVGENRSIVKTDGGDYGAGAIILASGSRFKKLNVPGEEFLGKGVSYCATCDGAFFRGQRVAVVGGGDTALAEALFLTQFASQVGVIHRRDELRAGKVLQKRAMANSKVNFIWNSVVEEITGQEQVKGIRLRNVKTGEKSTLDVSGVFVSVGFEPNTEYLKGVLKLDEMGHILANELMETGVPGVFAAGDVRHNSARQAITAAGDGATAALSAEKFIRGLK